VCIPEKAHVNPVVSPAQIIVNNASILIQADFPIFRTFLYFSDISLFFGHFSILRTFLYFSDISLFFGHFSIYRTFLCFSDISLFFGHFSIFRTFLYFSDISLFFGHFSSSILSIFSSCTNLSCTSTTTQQTSVNKASSQLNIDYQVIIET